MKRKLPYLKKVTHYYDESTGRYLPVIDKIAATKKKGACSSAGQFKLLKAKQKKDVAKIVRAKKKAGRPVPGGVGFGVYYNQNFHWAFSNFSCIDFGILAPPFAGGNSNDHLYLTATNGTALGVEALVDYDAQAAPVFRIFDWARPDSARWVWERPCSQLSENFSTITINNLQHNFCRVLNKTERVTEDTWENKVMLYNFTGPNWDLVYAYQYPATLAQQKQVHFGSWGPIVETFQEDYTVINPMGFVNSTLFNDSGNALLKPSNSFIRDDNDGIDIAFRTLNHTFYVL